MTRHNSFSAIFKQKKEIWHKRIVYKYIWNDLQLSEKSQAGVHRG